VPTDLDPAVPNPTNVPPTEFRRYRRFVSWFVFCFVLLGSAYMLVSVAVTISRRYQAVPLGSPIGIQASRADMASCYDELADVVEGLQKYLDNSSTLMAHYDADEAQRWSEAGVYWRGQWKAVGQRCRFDSRRGNKDWEDMAVLHQELHETETSFTIEVLRFGGEVAPRLDRLRERLARVGHHLSAGSEPGPGSSP
jgi:hypothetical protein